MPNRHLSAKWSLPRKISAARFMMLLLAAWSVMTFTHESGHIIGGWCCGGTLQDADLLPWHMPFSIFDPDPHPLVTLWCGPVLGVLIPLAFAVAVRKHWAWFIAYFCILSNGLYLATAWLSGDRFLDTQKLLEHGAHPVTIALFCVLTIAFGYVGFRRECIRVLWSPSRTAVMVTTNPDVDVNKQTDERKRPAP